MLMEYCGRKSLYHVMNAKGELGWDRVFAFVAGAVRGINALHNWSPPILHRDLKSLNLLITDSWAIRVFSHPLLTSFKSPPHFPYLSLLLSLPSSFPLPSLLPSLPSPSHLLLDTDRRFWSEPFPHRRHGHAL